MADYLGRCVIVIPAAALAATNAAIDNVEQDTGRGQTFGFYRLSMTGNLPVQAYAASTMYTQAMKTWMINRAGANFKLYFEDEGWTMETIRADLGGLQKIKYPMGS